MGINPEIVGKDYTELSMAELKKLEIQPVNDDLSSHGDPIKAQYNPGEVTIETKNNYQRTPIPGLHTPITQFIGGEAQTLSMTLFFDTYEKKTDVRIVTNKVINLLEIDSDLHHPSVCMISWGAIPSVLRTKSFTYATLDSCSSQYIMFLENGTPVRAKLNVSFTEYRRLEDQVKDLKLESPDRTKYRLLKEGDSLWQLGYKEYGNPAYWRTIAETNRIDNPRFIEAGTMLKLPPLE